MLLLKQFFVVLIVVYLILAVIIYLRQESFIFFPVKQHHSISQGENIEEYTFSHDGETLNGWILNKASAHRNLLIYYGGNAEDIFHTIADFKSFTNTACIFINYRGYGSSTGTPGEKELFRDALAILTDLQTTYSPQKTYLFGRSLGSGIATYVAGKVDIDGLVLITPFDSIESLARDQFPFFPTTFLLKHPFKSIENAASISCPSLIIYGGRDRTVPPKSTERLLKGFGNNTTVILIEDAEHNNISQFKEYSSALHDFLSQKDQQIK